jgi:hypothetical protein
MPRYSTHFMEMARRGVVVRIKELEAELAQLKKVFGHLPFGSAVSPAIAARESEAIPRRKRNPMSAAARRKVSLRMRRYWAKRRAEKPGKK